MKAKLYELIANTTVKFGTSGVRGLVSDLTDNICYAFTLGFLRHLEKKYSLQKNTVIGIAGDLRKSTPSLMVAVYKAIMDYGFQPVSYGLIPTPAISHYGIENGIPTIMVTGSHIPEDRNGIKFYTTIGEILKEDEESILNMSIMLPDDLFTLDGSFKKNIRITEVANEAVEFYINRYLEFFPDFALSGCHIGVYEHSSVARETLKFVLERLGATVTTLGRSDKFISVDTEAIRAEDIQCAKAWAKQHDFTSIVSTDGDGDRPLISDENGNWIRGDVAGTLCARYLNADIVVTPVSCNTLIESSGYFRKTFRTKIGSPYVIDWMLTVDDHESRIVGFEANGGFLQRTSISNESGILKPLLTRDSFIVILSVIHLAKTRKTAISNLLKELPSRYTYSARIKEISTQQSLSLVDDLVNSSILEDVFSDISGQVRSIDRTDGLRITYENSEIIHLRPSGNAPELRCYTEAISEERASQINTLTLERIRNMISHRGSYQLKSK